MLISICHSASWWVRWKQEKYLHCKGYITTLCGATIPRAVSEGHDAIPWAAIWWTGGWPEDGADFSWEEGRGCIQWQFELSLWTTFTISSISCWQGIMQKRFHLPTHCKNLCCMWNKMLVLHFHFYPQAIHPRYTLAINWNLFWQGKLYMYFDYIIKLKILFNKKSTGGIWWPHRILLRGCLDPLIF